ncbi:hypothetical protein A5741_12045 [Mycolicibacterium conceptionense]|nr:hypothetical protein A5741_12045 [Mycolicibacterium conceptionense]
MTAGFGGSGYTNPQTRALNSIANGGPADTTSQEKMAELLQRHSAQLRYLAANQKQLQKGINEATANPIEQLQQFVADIIVLLGGGELAKGALDFGDLQYILPALGALFGFGDGPFPISLFEAASKFFFGYVVPQEQFVDVINNIITAWAGVFGIDPEFVADVRDLLTAVGNLFGGLGNLLPSLQQLFDALGINGADLGPLGQVLAPIIQLFAGIDLTKFGDFIEFITDAISPVIQQLTAVINFINGVVAVLGYDGGDVVNSPLPALLQPFENLISFLANINLFGDDFNPAAAVEQFVNAMLLPLNLLLGPNSPLNALNIFGRISLPQFGGGVPIMALTTAVPNELEPFTATSVPTSDGWSYNAAEDAAQVICDGSLKTLYLRSGVIKVEEGQPLDTSIEVKYSGITSGAGQTIRYVLETFTTDNGSGTPTPVIVGAVTNPSGTITTSVTLGDASWDIPTGVKSVRPALVADESITAGTVYWKNIPELYKKLDPVFAGGLPAVLNNLGDWIETLVDQLLGALGLPALGSLFDKIMDLGDEIEGWFDDTLNTASDLAGLIGDLLSNPASVIGTLTQSMVSGLGDLNTLVNQIRDILAGLVVTPINSTVQAIKDWFSGLTGKTSGLNSSGQMNGTNIIGTIASNVVEGLDDIGDGLHDTWNKFWDGIFKTTGSTGKTAADVQTAAASVSTTAAIAQESTATLANLMNAPKNVPFWVSSNPFEDVVFPRVMASEAKIFTGGRLYLTALRTTQNRIYNQVGFMTNGGDPQENVFVAVYRIDPANGTYTLEYNFGNVSSQILTGSGLVDQRFNMPYDLQASEGDLWAVGVLTTGAGSYPGLVCVASSAMDYTGLHPRYACRLPG